MALFFNNFGTCGIESWDREISEIAREFRSPGELNDQNLLPDLKSPPAIPTNIINNNHCAKKSNFQPGERYTGEK